MERCLTSLPTRKLKVKTLRRSPYIPTRMDKISDYKYGQGVKQSHTTILENHLAVSFEAKTSLLSIYSKEVSACLSKDTYKIFFVAFS